MFPLTMIGKIWHTADAKHESTQSAIYEFFQTIASALNMEGLDVLFKFIDEINDYNESTITLIQKTT